MNLYEEFKEKMELDEEDASPSNRAKTLSLKLLETKEPHDVLQIFEREFIRKPEVDPLGEELCMVLKFLQHAIKENMSRERGSQLINGDIRVQNLIDWLMARYEPLEIEYKIATTFSLGILISAYDLQFTNQEYNMKIVQALDGIEIPPDRLQEVPVLVFILGSFITEESEQLVTAVVEQLSAVYFAIFRDRLDLATCSTLS